MQTYDVILDQRNTDNTGFDERIVTPGSNGLLGFDSNKNPAAVAIGAGLTLSGNTLVGNTNAGGGGGAFSASGGSSTFATLVFTNGGGVTFTNTAGRLGASVRTDWGGTGFTSAGSNVGLSATIGTAGLSLSATVPNVTNSSMSFSDGNTSGTLARLAFTNANGITLSLSTGAGGSHTLVGSHNGLTIQSNAGFSASGGSSTFQTLNFANSNGVTFSNSNGSVVASYSVPTVTNSSWSVSDAATSGTVGRLAFTNLNGVTLSLSSGTGGLHTIVGSHNGITSQSNQTLGIYGVSNTVLSSSGTIDARSLSFEGAGVASVGFSNGSVVISVPAGGVALGTNTFGASNLGNTVGTSGVITGTGLQMILVGGNNITLSQSILLSAATITISAPNQSNQQLSLYAASNTTQGTSMTANASNLSFQGAGVASVGMSNGSVVISVPSGGAGVALYDGANSISSGTARFSNSNGVTFGFNGQTITASVVPPVTFLSYRNIPQGLSSSFLALASLSSAAASIFPVTFSNHVSAGVVEVWASMNFVTLGTSSGQQSGGLAFVLYSKGTGASSTRMDSVVSTSFSWGITGNNSSYSISQVTATSYTGYGNMSQVVTSAEAVSGRYTGLKKIAFPVNTMITPGVYAFCVFGTASSSSVNVGLSVSILAAVGQPNSFAAPIGSFSSAYTANNDPFGGRFDMMQGLKPGNTALPPASYGVTDITGQANGGTQIPYLNFWST